MQSPTIEPKVIQPSIVSLDSLSEEIEKHWLSQYSQEAVLLRAKKGIKTYQAQLALRIEEKLDYQNEFVISNYNNTILINIWPRSTDAIVLNGTPHCIEVNKQT